MKYKIYKLVYNNEVIYVGYTKRDLKVRFNAVHLFIPKEIKKESSIELIEETDDKSREEYWRKYYEDLGCSLYNKRRGVTGLTKVEGSKEWSENNIEYRKEYYKNNKEKIKEWHKNNRERSNQIRREYYKKNSEKLKQIRREYYKKNKR